MAWERFEYTGKDSIPKLTIRKNGLIGLNNSAVLNHNLKSYTHVVLFIDKASKKIGLKFSKNEAEPGARKVKFHEMGGATVPARSFCHMNNLQENRLACHFDAKDEMLVANYE